MRLRVSVSICLLVISVAVGFFTVSYFVKMSGKLGSGKISTAIPSGGSSVSSVVPNKIWVNNEGEYVFNLVFDDFDSTRVMIFKEDGTSLGESLLAAKVILMDDRGEKQQVFVPLLVWLNESWLVRYSEAVDEEVYSSSELAKIVEDVKNELTANAGWRKGNVMLVNLTEDLNAYYAKRSYVDARVASFVKNYFQGRENLMREFVQGKVPETRLLIPVNIDLYLKQ